MRRPLCISIAVLIILFPYLTCLAVFERPAGDLTGDFLVNMDDLFDFASRWLDAMGGPADLYLGEGVTLSDFAVLAENWGADARPVLITEFMAANGSSLPLQPGELLDSDGDASDWLELHNPGDAAVEIGGCYLTDDPDNPKKWRFPDGLQLESGQYLVVFASGKDRAVAGRPLHTSFSLRADGEYLALVASDGRTVLHEYASHLLGGGLFGFPPQERNVSYGLYENRERYFALPTPGAANDPIYIGFVGDLDVSPGRGIRHAAFTATLSINTADAVIRYTTDGSEPSVSNGTTYTQPIEVSTTTTLRAVAIKTGWRPSKIATHTYIFPMDVRTQKAPLDYPTVWSGYPADYVMDPEICTAGEYRNDIVPALTSIPTLSIVTHKNNLFSPIYNATTGGIYAYPGHSSTGGLGWERPTSVEYLNTPDGSEFQIDCGIRIYGGENRNPQKCPKHSFRLLFKGQYGPTKLKFPLFGKDAAQQFDTLLLRGGFNNSWIHWDSNQRLRSQYIHDQWVRDTQLAMGQVAAHGVYVHLYLNGLYWGIYNITERPDTSFAASYYGGEKEEWDALNSSVPTGDGSKTSWKTAQTIANTHNISTPEGYAALAEQVDIDNLIDYMIVNLHSGNMDWDDHNWYAAKRRVDGEGFKFFCWDSERTLENAYGDNRVNINQSDKPSRLYTALRQNAEFRLDFADHVHRHFANHGALTPKAAKQRWLTRARELDMAIIAESARWGDYRRDLHPYSSGPYHLYTKFDHWLPEQMRLLNAYFPVRTDVVMGFFRNAGLYPSVDPPRFWVGGLVQHGGTIPIGQPIALGQPAGTAYYTLDGSDPRLGGLPYTGPFTLVRSAVVKTRLRSGAQWSALNEAVFTVGPVPQSLRITELMYHPWTDPNVLSPEPEFVELANIGAQAINLNLCR
ncbi:MAG: chitobiase/beta-hexosaminidase C-terminal domain-containing protein, partial [Phycisphaerae bacterium]|nr:chitobiase/beta-hexosaminidase C-terminal domain-containing protein [Phycisphaerae bacterium]